MIVLIRSRLSVRFLSHHNRQIKEPGFTLVELLVIAPVAVLVIAGIIALMINLVGDSTISRDRSISAYNLQSALDRIEQDARLATVFLSSYSMLNTPQGRDDTTGAFSASSPNNDLIVNQYATTSSPLNVNRQVVYYKSQPNACGAANTILNPALTVKIIYFLKSGSLWRRTIVPAWSLSASDQTAVCDTPWQRNSCSLSATFNAYCQSRDELILDNVSSITTTYYTTGSSTTTNPVVAKSIRTVVTQSKTVAGETITNSGVARATRTNTSYDDTPDTPANIRIYNAALSIYNQPLKSSFTWNKAKNARYYKTRYKINSGAWSSYSNVLTNVLTVSAGRPLDTITVGVISSNDIGDSAEAQFLYQRPLWTNCELKSPWVNYSPAGNGYATAAYTITSANIVVMKGLVTGGASGTPTYGVCTLPEGLRPSAHLIHTSTMDASGTYGVPARVDVGVAGGVDIIYHPTVNWVSLDAVKFVAAGAVTWTNATLNNGWTNYVATYGGPFAPVQYATDASGRTQVQGLLTPGNQCTGCNIWFVPAAYRPGQDLHFPAYANSTVTFPLQGGGTYEFNSYGIQASDGNLHAKGTLGGTYETNQTMWHPSSYSGWLNLTLQNSWVHYGGAYATPQYTKASDGIVQVKGLITRNTVGICTLGEVITTLPVGYRPKETQIYLLDSYANFGRIDVQPNGNIICVNNNYGWTALDNIKFLAEQ